MRLALRYVGAGDGVVLKAGEFDFGLHLIDVTSDPRKDRRRSPRLSLIDQGDVRDPSNSACDIPLVSHGSEWVELDSQQMCAVNAVSKRVVAGTAPRNFEPFPEAHRALRRDMARQPEIHPQQRGTASGAF